ncbi:MAG TPA: hypothetical protein VFL12_06900 [Thermoanaerobaculia bacterium]|nr:hypothetical protein [Thermoanaerobaculia bacterium]
MREWHADLPCPLDRPVRECAGHPLDERPRFVEGLYRWICRDGQGKQAAADEKLTPQPWAWSPVSVVDGAHCPVCGRELHSNLKPTCDRWDCERWAKRMRDRAATEIPRGSLRCSDCGEIESTVSIVSHRCIERIEEGETPARFV